LATYVAVGLTQSLPAQTAPTTVTFFTGSTDAWTRLAKGRRRAFGRP
jgi:hypothetical protein